METTPFKIAVIDQGTNTCNLLIAELYNNNIFKRLLIEKRTVKLLKESTKDNKISEAAIQRCCDAFYDYSKIIKKTGVKHTFCNATSALRNATNSNTVIEEVKKASGLTIEIISGDKEAELIYKAIKNLVIANKETKLIMDIGGGSTEFIAYKNNDIKYIKSFDLGIARLLTNYKFNPILSKDDITFVKQLFNTELKPLINFCKNENIAHLIGASGSFNTLAKIANKTDTIQNNKYEISINNFLESYDSIIKLSPNELKALKGMDISRIEMIPLAFTFIKFIIEELNIKKITYSSYALKEGIIFNYFENSQFNH